MYESDLLGVLHAIIQPIPVMSPDSSVRHWIMEYMHAVSQIRVCHAVMLLECSSQTSGFLLDHCALIMCVRSRLSTSRLKACPH